MITLIMLPLINCYLDVAGEFLTWDRRNELLLEVRRLIR